MNVIKIKSKAWIAKADTQCPITMGQKVTLYIDKIDPMTINQIHKIFDIVRDL